MSHEITKQKLINRFKSILNRLESGDKYDLSIIVHELYDNTNALSDMVDLLADQKHPSYFCKIHETTPTILYSKPKIVCEDCYEEARLAFESDTETEEQHSYYMQNII